MTIEEIVNCDDSKQLLIERFKATELSTNLHRRFAELQEDENTKASEFTILKGELTLERTKLDIIVERIGQLKEEELMLKNRNMKLNHNFRIAAKEFLKPETFNELDKLALKKVQEIKLAGKFKKEFLA